MDKLVEVKGLQKNFGQFQALKDVSFEVNAGEVLGYIGPNGAGKSTTIRILLESFERPKEKFKFLVRMSGKIQLRFIKKLLMFQGMFTFGQIYLAEKRLIYF